VADALDHLRTGGVGEGVDDGVAAFPVGSVHLRLHQFVVLQRQVAFADDACGGAGVAHQDDRLEVVSEAAQVFSLFLAECHGVAVYQQPGLRERSVSGS